MNIILTDIKIKMSSQTQIPHTKNYKPNSFSLEYSRSKIVDFEKVTKERTRKFYEEDKLYEFKTKRGAHQGENKGTISLNNEFKNILIETLEKIKLNEYYFLEVGAGNGFNTSKINNILKEVPKNFNYVATDIYAYEPSYYPIELLPSEQAVSKYTDTNILVLVSPPPDGHMCYMDYYAIKTFEIDDNKQRYVIFIGELGASDGTEGMYLYMKNSKYWRLIHRKCVCSFTVNLFPFGENEFIVKDLFLFERVLFDEKSSVEDYWNEDIVYE